MDLPTHFAFTFAVGLIFFDRPEIALLVARLTFSKPRYGVLV
jgi:hypothetical protein